MLQRSQVRIANIWQIEPAERLSALSNKWHYAIAVLRCLRRVHEEGLRFSPLSAVSLPDLDVGLMNISESDKSMPDRVEIKWDSLPEADIPEQCYANNSYLNKEVVSHEGA